MKKKLFAVLLAGMISISYSIIVEAATITIKKPEIQFNSDQEESALSKKMNEWEKAKQDAKAKQEQREQKLKDKKKEWEKAKQEAKAEQERKKQEAKAKQEQRQNAIKSFKDSFK